MLDDISSRLETLNWFNLLWMDYLLIPFLGLYIQRQTYNPSRPIISPFKYIHIKTGNLAGLSSFVFWVGLYKSVVAVVGLKVIPSKKNGYLKCFKMKWKIQTNLQVDTPHGWQARTNLIDKYACTPFMIYKSGVANV